MRTMIASFALLGAIAISSVADAQTAGNPNLPGCLGAIEQLTDSTYQIGAPGSYSHGAFGQLFAPDLLTPEQRAQFDEIVQDARMEYIRGNEPGCYTLVQQAQALAFPAQTTVQ